MNTNNQEKTRRSAPFVVLALLLCLTVPFMAVPAGAELFEDNVYIELGDIQINLPLGIERYPNIAMIANPAEQAFYLIASFSNIDIDLIINSEMLIVNYGGFIVDKIAYKAIVTQPDEPIVWVEGIYFPVTSSGFVSIDPSQLGIQLRGNVDFKVSGSVGDPNPLVVELLQLSIEVESGGDLENGLNTCLTSMGFFLTALFTPTGSLFPLSVTIGFGIALGVISWASRKNKKFY